MILIMIIIIIIIIMMIIIIIINIKTMLREKKYGNDRQKRNGGFSR